MQKVQQFRLAGWYWHAFSDRSHTTVELAVPFPQPQQFRTQGASFEGTMLLTT